MKGVSSPLGRWGRLCTARGERKQETYLFDMRRDCTRVSLIEDRRNEHGRQRRAGQTHTRVPHVRASYSASFSPRRATNPLPRDMPPPPLTRYTTPLSCACARARGNGK